MTPHEIEVLHKSMIRNYAVGQKVRALEPLGDAPCGDSPGGTYARQGDILVVRAINADAILPIKVSHENIVDSYFLVAVNEIEVIDNE